MAYGIKHYIGTWVLTEVKGNVTIIHNSINK